jgi:hypothetical protein
MPSSGLSSYAQSVDTPDNFVGALDRILLPAPGYPIRPEAESPEPCLNISVIFTSEEGTIAALSEAGKIGENLGARIALLVMQRVPFPLPLDDPPVLVDWNEDRLRDLASRSGVEPAVRIYLCRNPGETLRSVLQPGSIVVIGCRKRVWPTSDVRLARALRQLGHEVIVAKAE